MSRNPSPRDKKRTQGGVRKPVRPSKRAPIIAPAGLMKSVFSWLLKIGLVCASAAGFYFLWPVANQPVTEVAFTGDLTRVDMQEMRERVRGHATTGLLMLDIERLDSDLESMDWVYAAEIRKSWPSRLEIAIEQEQPVARWGDTGYLAASGEMVSSESFDDLIGLPDLQVRRASPQDTLELFYALSSAMKTYGLSLTQLTQSPYGSWSMEMENGSRVMLGKEELIVRIKRVMNAWASYDSDQINQLESVDARYPNGIAVKYRTLDTTEENPA